MSVRSVEAPATGVVALHWVGSPSLTRDRLMYLFKLLMQQAATPGSVIPGIIIGGQEEDGSPLYVARAYWGVSFRTFLYYFMTLTVSLLCRVDFVSGPSH